MSDFAIGNEQKSQGIEYVPFWKKELNNNLQGSASHIAFNSAFDVASGRENYKTT